MVGVEEVEVERERERVISGMCEPKCGRDVESASSEWGDAFL